MRISLSLVWGDYTGAVDAVLKEVRIPPGYSMEHMVGMTECDFLHPKLLRRAFEGVNYSRASCRYAPYDNLSTLVVAEGWVVGSRWGSYVKCARARIEGCCLSAECGCGTCYVSLAVMRVVERGWVEVVILLRLFGGLGVWI